MESEIKKVRFDDTKNHCWIDGVQYVSINRFIEAKNDVLKEMKILCDEVSKLSSENDAYKVLLKEKLEKEK